MPTFRTAPSGNLVASIQRMMQTGGPNLSPLQEMEADRIATKNAHESSLVAKARQEVEAAQRNEQLRADPAAQTQYAADFAGIGKADGTQLYKALRDIHERPDIEFDNGDETLTGAPETVTPVANRMPDITYARPEVVTPGQTRLFQTALATLGGMGMATGHTNAHQLALAAEHINRTALTNQAANEQDPEVANPMVAAIAGHLRQPFRTDAHGTVLNTETGDLDESGKLAGSVRAVRDAQAKAATASSGRTTAGGTGGRPPTGFRFLADGTLEPIPGGPADPLKDRPKPSEAPSVSGSEYLATLPESQREQIKNVAEGRTPLTTFSTKGGHRERIHQMVLQYDPSYNATRSNAWKEFTTGATGKNIVNINQAIGHMGTMYELADAMNNKDTRVVNAVLNKLSTAMGNPEVNNFETARQAVTEELMRTFRQVGASEKEAAAWEQRFNSANSPEQLKGAVKVAGELLNSRIKAVNDSWKRATQSKDGFPDILSPDNTAVMGKISAYSGADRRKAESGWSIKKVE